jgi:hypothetical protein
MGYGLDKNRLIEWVSSYGGSPDVARDIISEYAKSGQKFQNHMILEKSLLIETYKRQRHISEEFRKMKFLDKVKWLLTQGR